MALGIRTMVSTVIEDARCFGLSFPIQHVWHAAWNRSMRASIPGFGSINIRPGTSDIRVVRQIFLKKEYDTSDFFQHSGVLERYRQICDNGRTPVIIDAGANIGASSIWFASKYPNARVFSVEPDPENVACCRANTAAYANIVVVGAAIGSSAGAAVLSNPSGMSWGVQTQRGESDEGSVEICTVPDLVATVDKGELFIVKIDIEGFESDLFSTNTAWIRDATVIVIEPHDWMLPGQKSSSSFQKALAQHDFEVVLSGENLMYFNV
jgi:FkbM family methyltransferase